MTDELDIWSIDVAAVAGRETRLSAVLNDEERDRAHRFVRSADALRYRVTHGALRMILSDCTGIAPRQIRFSYGEQGKPSLRDGGPHFSLSHSGSHALVAVSAGRDVGVDVEEVRAMPYAQALAQRFLASDLAAKLEDLPACRRDLRFMRIWTALEAIVKAEGNGLAEGFATFELRETGDDRARAWVAGVPPDPLWSVRWLEPASTHVGAVAVRGGDFAVRVRRFA